MKLSNPFHRKRRARFHWIWSSFFLVCFFISFFASAFFLGWVSAQPSDSPAKLGLREQRIHQKQEMKALIDRQKQEKRKWQEDEKTARRAFFEAHLKGAERRAYVKEMIQRRKALLQRFDEEKKQLKDQHSAL